VVGADASLRLLKELNELKASSVVTRNSASNNHPLFKRLPENIRTRWREDGSINLSQGCEVFAIAAVSLKSNSVQPVNLSSIPLSHAVRRNILTHHGASANHRDIADLYELVNA
jgi:hypothetical protein